jgi:adenylate kinase
MVIVVTGMVGLDKKGYLEKVCRLASDRGKEVLLCNVGDMMYDEAPDIASGKILDIPLKRLHALRRSVFKDIIAKAKKTTRPPRRTGLIVNTHATFRWRHGLFPAVDFDQMRQLGADMYICLIDGVAALHNRLLREHSSEYTLKDLIVWREEEIIGTEMLCKGINEETPFYCLARGGTRETTETFYQLLFEPKIKRAYLSYPMTAVVDLEDVKKEISGFRQIMKQHFTCFDPGDLEESFLPRQALAAAEDGKAFLEVATGGKSVRLDLDQIRQIERDIYSQTYARDFLLIDKAEMIIGFIPTLPDGRAAISSGVERELQHAHEAAKEVYLVWPAKQTPSVFITQTATKVFSNITDALEFFKKKKYIKPA